jgi:hypothetical protein
MLPYSRILVLLCVGSWPCLVNYLFFVNHLALFEVGLDVWTRFALHARKTFDNMSQFIFGLSATQWRSLFIMRHCDVVIVFVESQWYNDTSPEYCFSLRAATRDKVFTICLSNNDIKNIPTFSSVRFEEKWRGEIPLVAMKRRDSKTK